MAGTFRRLFDRVRGHETTPADRVAVSLFGLAARDDVAAITRRLDDLKADLDRSLCELRGWSRALAERLDASPETPGLPEERSAAEAIAGLAYDVASSLAAISGYTELLLRDARDDVARRRLDAVLRLADEAAATVRRVRDLVVYPS